MAARYHGRTRSSTITNWPYIDFLFAYDCDSFSKQRVRFFAQKSQTAHDVMTEQLLHSITFISIYLKWFLYCIAITKLLVVYMTL